jgi:hypothetical protein
MAVRPQRPTVGAIGVTTTAVRGWRGRERTVSSDMEINGGFMLIATGFHVVIVPVVHFAIWMVVRVVIWRAR